MTATELVFSMGMALFTGGEQTSPVSLTQNIHLNLYSSLVGQGAIDEGNMWNSISVVVSPLLAIFMAHNYNQGGSDM